MKKFITTLHRWLGFPVGLLFLITFGTGCLTGVDELLERLERMQTNTHYTYRPTSIAEDAQAIAIISADKKSIRQIVLPTVNTPYYQVVARGERWLYAIDELNQANHIVSNQDGFFQTVLQLHRNFLLGKEGLFSIEGKHYVAWCGLISLFISLIGLWMWWPKRKSFALKNALPQGKKRKHFYLNHMTGGVLVLIVIVLLSITGATITYRALTKEILGIATVKASAQPIISVDNNWHAWIAAATAQMPSHSRLEHIRFPRKERKQKDSIKIDKNQPPALYELRFNTPQNWLGLSRSQVKIDPQRSQITDISQFGKLTLSEKFYSILVPLHTGHNLPAPYLIVLLIFSILATIMVLSGVISFVIKKRKKRKKTFYKSYVFARATRRPESGPSH
jgi:uncharacterized iron-regulated membrane protein